VRRSWKMLWITTWRRFRNKYLVSGRRANYSKSCIVNVYKLVNRPNLKHWSIENKWHDILHKSRHLIV
jgi:hypothetical protein